MSVPDWAIRQFFGESGNPIPMSFVKSILEARPTQAERDSILETLEALTFACLAADAAKRGEGAVHE
jgi:hypothetical protein